MVTLERRMKPNDSLEDNLRLLLLNRLLSIRVDYL